MVSNKAAVTSINYNPFGCNLAKAAFFLSAIHLQWKMVLQSLGRPFLTLKEF